MSAQVVFALALVSLIIVFVFLSYEQYQPQISMLDLKEFKGLPVELRGMIRRMMPDPDVMKTQWASMSPQQKQMALQHMLHQHQPRPAGPPAPATKIKWDLDNSVELDNSAEDNSVELDKSVEDNPIQEEPKGLKSGFLLPNTVDKRKKKDSKDKKHNKVVTFSDVGASEGEAPADDIITEV